MSKLIYTGRDEEGILLHVFTGRNWTKKWLDFYYEAFLAMKIKTPQVN